MAIIQGILAFSALMASIVYLVKKFRSMIVKEKSCGDCAGCK